MWRGTGGTAALASVDATLDEAEAASPADGGGSSATIRLPSCVVSHATSPEPPWKALTLDCHATTTDEPERASDGGGVSASTAPCAGMCASQMSPPIAPHSRT